MNYIYKDASGAMRFDRYFEYLSKIKDQLGEHVFSFAADPGRYYLDTPGTLHDAWLSDLNIGSALLAKPLATNIEIKLLGAFHDREFLLQYQNVLKFDINWVATVSPVDLLTHEFRCIDSVIEHEYQFDHEMKLQISCTSMQWFEIFRK
ncbi:hypothetical protein LRH25_32540 [Ideonella azotifigens]|uniref:Uncharacterized protein n=1 Tax=Ideonella azotifigens TaxID=513160 RepID=A0ABN1KE43_9BURK|nr:hypothetical protein [Ideonella azotifigens]MCD2345045.1 hypothetical protein [Ideonella azotifigens]